MCVCGSICSTFCLSMRQSVDAAETFLGKCLSGHVFSLLVGGVLRVDLLGHMEAHGFEELPDCLVPFSFLTIWFLCKVFLPVLHTIK